MASDEAQAQQSFRLRVANLAWETEDQAFKDFFSKYNPSEAVIIRRKKTNRSRGYGFVNFDNEADMNAALELNGSELGGREITIAVSTSKGPYPEGSKKPQEARGGDDAVEQEQSAARLIVQRLGWEVDDDKLAEAFGKFGEVESAKVIKNRRSQRSRGYGFVTFKNEEDGQKALDALNGNEELGFTQKGENDEETKQPIRVAVATAQKPKPKAEPKKRAARKQRRAQTSGDGDEADRPGPRRLFIRDLKEETGEDALKEAFSSYGEIKNIRIVLDRETEKSKGIAFVTFNEHESFKQALAAFTPADEEQESGGQIDGADVVVKRALPSRFIRNRRGGGRGGRGGRRRGRGQTAGGGATSGTAL